MPKKKSTAKAPASRTGRRATAKSVRSNKGVDRGTDRPRSRAARPVSAAEPGHRRAASESEAYAAIATVAESADRERRTPQPFPVVGIGASAGGLEALTQLLEKMPAAAGMALVVVLSLMLRFAIRAKERRHSAPGFT